MSRSSIDFALEDLKSDIVRMGSQVHDMVELAVQSVLNDAPVLAMEVSRMEAATDEAERSIINKSLELSIRTVPVASDLLFLNSTLVVVGEIEKAADDASKLARRSAKLSVPFPSELRELMIQMDHDTRALFLGALSVYANYDEAAALRIIEADRDIDRNYKTSRRAVLEKMVEDPENKRQHFRIGEMFHALEHVSDHAVNICKAMRLIYTRPNQVQ